jgi:hypothetical protein
VYDSLGLVNARQSPAQRQGASSQLQIAGVNLIVLGLAMEASDTRTEDAFANYLQVLHLMRRARTLTAGVRAARPGETTSGLRTLPVLIVAQRALSTPDARSRHLAGGRRRRHAALVQRGPASRWATSARDPAGYEVISNMFWQS